MSKDAGMLERLLADHRRIAALAQAYGALCAGGAAEMDAVEQLRWALTRDMMHHVAFEDRAVCLPLERDPRAHVAAIARAMKAELVTLYADYARHVTRWPSAAAARDWPAYGYETIAILKRLTDRIAREERELYPLAAGNAEIARGMPARGMRNWARCAMDLEPAIRAR